MRTFEDGPDGRRKLLKEYVPRKPLTVENLLAGYDPEVVIFPSAAVVRLEALRSSGLFAESLWVAEDLDLWIRLAGNGAKLGLNPACLALRRKHPESLTAKGSAMLACLGKVFDRAESTFELSPQAREAIRRRRAAIQALTDLVEGRRELAAGRVEEARRRLGGVCSFYKRFDPRVDVWSAYQSANWEQMQSGGPARPHARKLSLAVWALRVAPRLTEAAVKRRRSL